MKPETCEVVCVHEENVKYVQQNLPDLKGISLIFKALADETRLKISYALTLQNELCVCDVAAIIQSSTATASHHLRYLKDIDLAKSEKRGKLVYYRLADHHVNQLVKIAFEHAKEGEKIEST
ncbi:ArsR/SmtB family transcription factor [Paenisporosarcina antarctica]|uniref:Transcriptional regulator n=1 Tax=Paenisporosarcina antarctica TaxID=417367 RepID=A0A4P7A2A4_9BACL|nr:metalloregulator ArsR/SmtB family transcription factor [Paenisporosarcina antarctica]QBP43012.1 transcriptional regulator [Paenisporosarcina antarctica]